MTGDATSDEVWDVVVVGGGPAGSSAAIAAREAGASVLVIDREAFPRDKLCGGGLLQISVDSLPADFDIPVRAGVQQVTFTRDGGHRRDRHAEQPVIRMVQRREFDNALLAVARRRGAQIRERCLVRQFDDDSETVTVSTADGPVRARAVVGADGSAGRASAYVGARFDQVDVGLEKHVLTPPDQLDYWRDRVQLDWGPLPGSYGWVFPKGDQLTIGVIADRRRGGEARGYLTRFLAGLGLDDAMVVSEGGHLTHCRAEDSPVARGRVLLAGDAAGLLEPWTREGISFALRSGRRAGAAAARIAAGENPATATDAYAAAIDVDLGAEMRAGRRCLVAFERHPAWFHVAMTRTRPGWHAFLGMTTGTTNFARLLQRAPIRLGLAVAART